VVELGRPLKPANRRHEIADRSVEDVTEEILSEAALPEVSDAEVDLQADRFDHARDLRKHEAV
jgi:hypothetical protein